jgi:hypothetical protein
MVDGQLFSATKSGTIVSVRGNLNPWMEFQDYSIAANVYVLLCDQKHVTPQRE